MRTNLCHVFGIVLLSGTSGCAVLSHDSSNSEIEQQENLYREVTQIGPYLFSPEGDFTRVAVADLLPGQKVQIVTGTATVTEHHIDDTTAVVAGEVQNVSESELVLRGVFQTKYAVAEDTNAMLNKIPYVNRMFKNTAVGAMATAVPGKVTLSRDEIRDSWLLTDGAYDSLASGAPPRIGVDFDFADNSDAKQQQRLQ